MAGFASQRDPVSGRAPSRYGSIAGSEQRTPLNNGQDAEDYMSFSSPNPTFSDNQASSAHTLNHTRSRQAPFDPFFEKRAVRFGTFLPSWMNHYRLEWLKGDLVGALTVASLYIPLSFSFAALGHVPPASSLYAFVFHPPIYALLGSCSLMVVGPEATGSLLVGAAIRQSQRGGGDPQTDALISGAATALAGAMLLAAGALRLGFVDRILSRPLMKGFISGVGSVLIVEQALPGLGLLKLAEKGGVADSSAVFKLFFLLTHIHRGHWLTAAIATSTLAFILASSHIKARYGERHSLLRFFPDRVIAILVTALIVWGFDLEKTGLHIVGSVGSGKVSLPLPQWPFGDLQHLRSIVDTSLLISLFGYFESSVTAKSLRPLKHADGEQRHSPLSADRELVALGTANIVGGCFSTLPAFGGFGRSKLNAQAGSLTPMSSIFLGLISLVCVLFLTPWLYYVPKATLAAMSCAVGISMIEECHRDVVFFLKARAWTELALMVAVFLSIFVHSMTLGIEIGMLFTLLALIRSSTQSRVQVSSGAECGQTLTLNSTHPATSCRRRALEGLTIFLRESLTFANCGDFVAHIDSRVSEEECVRHIILDFGGVPSVDACGAQILVDALERHAEAGAWVTIYNLDSALLLQVLQSSGLLQTSVSLATD